MKLVELLELHSLYLFGRRIERLVVSVRLSIGKSKMRILSIRTGFKESYIYMRKV